MRYVKGLGRFWYDFVIGNDWKLAAVVVISLALTFAAFAADVVSPTSATVLGAALLVIGFTISAVIDVRRP